MTATVPQTSSSSNASSNGSANSSSSAKAAKPPLFEVRRSPIQGRGVFAIAPIRKGKRITEYLGEPITHEEADRRYDDNKGRHHTFLFILDDDTVLDARYQGSDARYINHSCEPNCESVIEDGHIWIEAIKAIKPETELAYDYQFEWQDEYEPEDIRYYACRCGSAKCRGTILKVPAYLRSTVKKWLAGDDVPKPRKPRRKTAKKAGVRKAAKKGSGKKSTSKKKSTKTTKAAKKTKRSRA
ncbi:MAG: SET domain-containing protein-lysine N-methyltransferase [Gemmatimonadota bacterium]